MNLGNLEVGLSSPKRQGNRCFRCYILASQHYCHTFGLKVGVVASLPEPYILEFNNHKFRNNSLDTKLEKYKITNLSTKY